MHTGGEAGMMRHRSQGTGWGTTDAGAGAGRSADAASASRLRVARLLLAVFAVVLVLVVVLKFDGSFQSLASIHENILATRALGEWSANFVPFATVGVYAAALPSAYAVRALAGGIVGFVPLGALLPAAFPQLGAARTLAIGLIVQVAIEVAQVLFAIGFFDIDDLILGMIGVVAGYLIWHFVSVSRA